MMTLIEQKLSSDDSISIETILPPGNLILVCKICTESEICSEISSEIFVNPRQISKQEVVEAVQKIDDFYTENQCKKAISHSRMLLATLESDENNWNNFRNGGCGAFFRASRVCMNDLKAKLYSGTGSSNEAQQLLANLIGSECRLGTIHKPRGQKWTKIDLKSTQINLKST